MLPALIKEHALPFIFVQINAFPTGFRYGILETWLGKKMCKALVKFPSVHKICLVQWRSSPSSAPLLLVHYRSQCSMGKSRKNLAHYSGRTTRLKRNALLLYTATALLLNLFYFFFSFSFLLGTTFTYVQIFPKCLNGRNCIQQSLAVFEILMKYGCLFRKVARCFSPPIILVDEPQLFF